MSNVGFITPRHKSIIDHIVTRVGLILKGEITILLPNEDFAGYGIRWRGSHPKNPIVELGINVNLTPEQLDGDIDPIDVVDIFIARYRELVAPKFEKIDETKLRECIAQKLTWARERKKLSIRDLSRLSGVNPKTVSGLESWSFERQQVYTNRYNAPSMTTLIKLCNVLEVKLEELFVNH